MNLIKKLFSFLFGKEPREHHYSIFFGDTAAKFGEHGVIMGTWFKEGYQKDIAISFFVEGNVMPPYMTPNLMQAIWWQAHMAGIDPKYVYSYKGCANTNPVQPAQRVPLTRPLRVDPNIWNDPVKREAYKVQQAQQSNLQLQPQS